ncbi:MAG TPA: alkaline phosphatase family protein, partial [Kofleriaceae bacterium]|nr:alkaline phosphatase family protein [Kofleriaceae bacterium]
MRLPAAAALVALALAAGCSSPATRTPTSTPKPGAGAPAPKPAVPPKLVVLLVIDQWPAWSFLAKRPQLRAGFDRLLREGEWHTGQHPSAATITAPGHALLGTGEPSATSGILSNEWYRRTSDRVLKSVEDPDSAAGSSARWLRAPGLGDAIAAAGTGAKAVSVSLKDRAAILLLGHAGVPIWYDKKTVSWTSTA